MKNFILILSVIAGIAGVIHLDNQMENQKINEKYGNMPPPKNAQEAIHRVNNM